MIELRGLTERPHLAVSDSVISMSVHWSGRGWGRMRRPGGGKVREPRKDDPVVQRRVCGASCRSAGWREVRGRRAAVGVGVRRLSFRVPAASRPGARSPGPAVSRTDPQWHAAERCAQRGEGERGRSDSRRGPRRRRGGARRRLTARQAQDAGTEVRAARSELDRQAEAGTVQVIVAARAGLAGTGQGRELDCAAILMRGRWAPAAVASVSRRCAPSPVARNAVSPGGARAAAAAGLLRGRGALPEEEFL